MAFTFAHPAVVIPLKRRFSPLFSLTGLVVGSMAPDFEYFLRMKPETTLSHTLLGIFIFALPMTLVVSAIYHWVIKKPLLLHLPHPFSTTFGGAAHHPWEVRGRNSLVLIYSALIGILSHLAWDSLTHGNGWVVQHWPLLQQTISTYGYQIPIYKLLQHGSGLLGLVLVAYFLRACPKRDVFQLTKEVATTKQKFMYWVMVIGCTLASMIPRLLFLSGSHGLNGINGKVTIILGILISTMIGGGFLALIIASSVARRWTARG